MSGQRVLVTGSSGRIGRAVVQELRARQHAVRGFDLVPTPGLDDMVVGSVTDPETLGRAMDRITTLIHLAATPDDDDFLARIVPNNIIGVHHTLEAARAAGVQRLILASSGQVVWFQRFTGPWPIDANVPPTPRYWYAAAKVFLEAAGRAFSDGFNMTVLAVRLGWCPRTEEHVEELKSIDWGKDVYLSPRDAGRFFACAVEARELPRFSILYATSRPVHKQLYDLETARRLIGYEPLDQWPAGLD